MSITPVMSSLESLKIPTSEASPAQIQKSGNFLNQLETMMNAVKKEASQLETMKMKIREMEDLKIRHNEVKSKLLEIEQENGDLKRLLKDSEMQNGEIRSDMQRLNDIYNSDRLKHIEMQQQNLRLEQELSGVRLEKEFFVKESQKIPELKKGVKGLKAQLAAAKAQHDEEVATLLAGVAEMEKKVVATERSKEEAAQHFWNLTEELNNTKRVLESNQKAADALTAELTETKRAAAQAKERLSMVAEDLQHTRIRQALSSRTLKSDAYAQALELQNLRSAVSSKENELHDLRVNFAHVEETQKADLRSLNGAAAKLQESVRELSAKNQELVRENSTLKNKTATSGADAKKAASEIEALKCSVKELEQNYALFESESALNMKVATNQRDDLSFQLQSVTAQFEALSAQAKGEQARHWEEQERLKESESALLEECEKLTQELSEKSVRLHAAESEKAATESNARVEVSGASNMVNALKDELEKRLEDLVALRRERDALRDERDGLVQQVEAARVDLAKSEASFKRAIDTERSTVKAEMARRAAKNKALESEKQEMLAEMNELMKEVGESKRGAESARQEAEDARVRTEKLNEQLDWVKTKNNDLVAELKSAGRVEQELRDKFYAAESKLKEEANRLQALVAETKKSSGLAVIELNGTLKTTLDEVEELRRQVLSLNDAEKKAQLEAERARSALENVNRQHEEYAAQQLAELGSMRRELDAARTKNKISIEAKGKTEMEVISLRQELTRAENDLHRQVETLRGLEGDCAMLNEKYKGAVAAVDGVSESNRQLKSRVLELEESVKAKNAALQHLEEDANYREREGLNETKRLRMQLNSAEAEINECRPLVPLLQKELVDVKTNFSKLQASANVKMDEMLRDLAAAEDKIMAERRRTDAVAAEWQSKVVALQAALEKRKDALDEVVNKSRAEKGDRELAQLQLEADLERARAALVEKDRGAEEFQKQHQSDRVKIHDLNKRLDEGEREAINLRTQLEMETQKTKRLEAKLRQTLTTGEHAAVVRGDFAASSPSGGGAGAGNFTFESGNGGGGGAGGGNGGGAGGYLSARTTYSRGGGERPAVLRTESRDSSSRHNPQQQHQQQYSDMNDNASHSSYRSTSNYEGRSESFYTNYSNSDIGAAGAAYGDGGSGAVEGYRAGTPNSRRFAVQQQQQQHQAQPRDLRGSQSVPSLFNDGVPVLSDPSGISSLHQQTSSAASYASSGLRSPDGASRRGASPFASPRGGGSYQAQPSPAAERVSATLAARTTAESSKIALKLAQQQRNAERFAGGGGSSSSVNGNDAAAFQYNALRKSGGNAFPAHHDDDDPFLQEAQPNGGGGGGASVSSSISGWQDAPIAPMQQHYQQSAGGGGGSDEIADRIAATQRMIERHKNKSGANAAASSSSAARHQAPQQHSGYAAMDAQQPDERSTKTPNSGRSSLKLAETIQAAHSLYPNANNAAADMSFHHGQGGGYGGDGGGDEEDDDISSPPHSLLVPSLHPASPPGGGGGASSSLRFNMNQSHHLQVYPHDLDLGGGGGGGGGGDEGSGGEEEEGDVAYAQEALGSATSKGSKKLKKKKAKKSSSSSSGGGGDGLQLPKLSAANKQMRR